MPRDKERKWLLKLMDKMGLDFIGSGESSQLLELRYKVKLFQFIYRTYFNWKRPLDFCLPPKLDGDIYL